MAQQVRVHGVDHRDPRAQENSPGTAGRPVVCVCVALGRWSIVRCSSVRVLFVRACGLPPGTYSCSGMQGAHQLLFLPAMLRDLPPELVDLVVSDLDPASLAALCGVSRSLRRAAKPRLTPRSKLQLVARRLALGTTPGAPSDFGAWEHRVKRLVPVIRKRCRGWLRVQVRTQPVAVGGAVHAPRVRIALSLAPELAEGPGPSEAVLQYDPLAGDSAVFI